MKILVISLLRLGDFLQSAAVLEGLRQKYPRAEIDVLTHKPVQSLQPMLPLVKRWWTLDRDELQMGLGRADIPLLTSFSILKERLDEVAQQDYDLVINLTQTVYAGWIAGYIPAKERLGLAYTAGGQAHFHSPWFRYLDQHSQVRSADIFNYTDIFHQACELKGMAKTWPLHSVTTSEVESLHLSEKPIVVIQLYTSEQRKNWPEESWIRCLNDLKSRHGDWQQVILGSPAERAGVERVAAAVGGTAALLSLPAALELLNRAELLITGDTSIKHLANAGRARVLELSLGPSDWQRTGIYRADSLILQPTLECAPCAHSGTCSQASHLCAQQLAPSTVAAAAELLINGDWAGLAKFARLSSPVKFLRTHHLETGFWFAADLAQSRPLETLDRLLDRCTLKFMFNQELKHRLVEFGSEGVRLENEIERLLPPTRHSFLTHLDFLDESISRQHEAGRFARETFARQQAGQKELDLAKLRQQQRRENEQAQQMEIKIKLIRSIKSRWMEAR